MDFSIIPFPELPYIHVYRKVEHGILVLSCHMYGFCPRTISIIWMKGKEIQDWEIEGGGIIPDSDGTFHTWSRTEALPGEWEQYQCQVEHPRMLEPGICIWGKAGTAESVNWEFGNGEFGNAKQQGGGYPSPSHHLALPRAGIMLESHPGDGRCVHHCCVMILIGFSIWKVQSGNMWDVGWG